MVEEGQKQSMVRLNGINYGKEIMRGMLQGWQEPEEEVRYGRTDCYIYKTKRTEQRTLY